jgi:hypothetical protein
MPPGPYKPKSAKNEGNTDNGHADQLRGDALQSGDRPQILLPGLARAESKFTEEVGNALGPRNVLFRSNNNVVEVQEESFDGELDRFKLAHGGLKFIALTPARAKTWLEQFIQTGVEVESKNGKSEALFKAKTMSESLARSLLESPQFLKRIPRVARILDVAIPIRTRNGDIVFPAPGFNRELGLYLAQDAPIFAELSLDEAIATLEAAYAGFCWKNQQSKVHAYARLLTPFARGLMGFGERPPLWFFGGNRPRCGKDYLNGVTQIAYLGHPFEDVAITDRPEETTKRIVSALRAGRRMMHFANCQHHLDDAGFIQAITAPTIGARSLGSNDAKSDLELPNEIDFSISANIGLTYREDVEPRLRKIELAFFDEDPNKRSFPNPFLHDWLKENRLRVLAAIYSLFRHWIRAGAPNGKTLFNSFPRWAQVVGGVMSISGLGDPCLEHEGEDLIGGDQKERAMKALYGACFEESPEEWIKKSDIYEVILREGENTPALEWFGNLKADAKPADKNFATKRIGNALAAFQNRILAGVRLLVDTSNQKSQQRRYKFTKQC